MSVEYFGALEAQIPPVEAERALALADAGVYPHLKREDAQAWWQKKTRTIADAVEALSRRAVDHFTVDGKLTDARGLRRWLRGIVGGGLGR